MKSRNFQPRIEMLEDRCTPATWSNPWPDATHLTLSFAPDGTMIDGNASNLFQTLNAIAPTKTWETIVLRAFQTWAAQANINLTVVSDDGAPFGAPGAIQNDPRFGDIRIGAYNMGPAAEAGASPFELDAGTWSGDVTLNSAVSLGINGGGQYDLFSVVLHEAGHVFGLPDNTNPASVEDIQYTGVRTGLGAVDIAALQAIYGGPRSLDQIDGVAANSQRSTAMPLDSLTNLGGLLSMTVNGDLSTLQDQDFFSFNTLLNLGGVDLTLRTAGISLLTPEVTVFNSWGQVVTSAVTTDPQLGGFEIDLANVAPLSTYYVEVQSGQENVFGIGSYALTVSELPLVNHLLGGVTATITYGLSAANNLIDANMANGSFTTAAPLPPMTAGPNGSYYESYRASLTSTTDAEYYKLSAPAASSSTEVLTAMVWGIQNFLDPQVSVYDAQQKLLPAQVLVNDGYSMVVQIANAVPSASYYVEVSPSSGGGSVGNYFLGLDVSQNAAALQSFAGGTLSAAQPTAIDTLVVTPRSQLLHLVLSAAVAGSTTPAAVQMTITDATGQIFFTLAAASGQSFTGNVILAPGAYTVVFQASTTQGKALPRVAYGLLGERMTDPDGPEATDPTQAPAGSTNGDGPDQDDWDDGSSTGVPPQGPSSGPYTGAAAPTVSLYSPGDQTNLGGDQVNLALTASDSANNALAFSATGLPAGLAIDPNLGVISGTIALGDVNCNSYVVTVTATDNKAGASATQTFYWTVNPPVVALANPGNQTNLAGDQVNLAPSASASDGDALTFNITGLPSGLGFDPNTGTISGTIAANAASSNPYVVTITATDPGSGVSASQTFNWTVNPPVLTLANPGNQTNCAGDQVNLALSASASDGDALTFNITGLPPGLTFDPNTGTISGTIAANAASSNPYVVTITATDPGSGVSVTLTFSWTVNPLGGGAAQAKAT